jgi:hypothetical protein
MVSKEGLKKMAYEIQNKICLFTTKIQSDLLKLYLVFCIFFHFKKYKLKSKTIDLTPLEHRNKQTKEILSFQKIRNQIY